MRFLQILSFLAVLIPASCARRVAYDSIYDPIEDVGQYKYPSLTDLPPYYADLTVSEKGRTPASLWQYNLAASISGLAACAIGEGRNDVGFWIPDREDGNIPYKAVLKSLEDNGCKKLGSVGVMELALAGKKRIGGHDVDMSKICDGYILTDIEKNPDSPAVATTAAHFYKGIIVDRADKAEFDKAGYKMVYDASDKTIPDAFNEFIGRCARNGFSVMPANTYELKDFSIQNGLFFMHMYHQPGRPETGDYWEIFEKCCSLMEPNSSVFGWEHSSLHDERGINGATSKYGLNTAVNDWAYNYPLANAGYRKRQKGDLARVLDPRTIDFSKNKKRFVSFYLTDGDNTQWMMSSFTGRYLLHPDASATRTSFGINTTLTPQISPEAYAAILANQPEGCSFIEVQGGGVIYSDSFAEARDRQKALKERARQTAAWMRQHRVRVLGLMARDSACSAEAQECYKAMIEANDQLVGVIALQYTPYAGGKGNIYWFKNLAGYDIPVVTVKYSIWNTDPPYQDVEGSPAFVARKLDSDTNNPDFNLVAIHAWSSFTDAGADCDETAELDTKGGIYSSGAGRLCMNHLDDSYEVVNIEEMLWQLRMRERPAQTKKYLRGLK